MTQGEVAGFVFGWLIVLVIWIWLSHAIGKAAERRGRAYWGFFWLSLLVSPIIMGIIVAALPYDDASGKAQTSAGGSDSRLQVSDTAECPYCAEEVKVKALVCKHCGRDIGDKLASEREAYFANMEIVASQLSQTGSGDANHKSDPLTKGPVPTVDGRCPKCNGTESYEWKVNGSTVPVCQACSFSYFLS
jgi:hypothetical protein